jgi:hypothetical protein
MVEKILRKQKEEERLSILGKLDDNSNFDPVNFQIVVIPAPSPAELF